MVVAARGAVYCWLPNNASHVSKKASAFYGATVEATEKKNWLCEISASFFSSFLSSLVLPSLVLAQEPVEGAKSVLYSISEVYVAKDRIKIKVRDPIVNSN